MMTPSQKEDATKTTEAVCIFCYKIIPKHNSSENRRLSAQQDGEKEGCFQKRKEILERFFISVDRHFAASANFKVTRSAGNARKEGDSLVNSVEKHVCLDCFPVVEQFCTIFHQLKCLELKLNWKIDKLWNLMKYADHVPSRVKLFREWVNHKNAGPSGTADLESNKDDCEKRDRNLLNFRKNFKTQCRRFRSRNLPRVFISPHSIELETIGTGTSAGLKNRIEDVDLDLSLERATIPDVNEETQNIDNGMEEKTADSGSTHEACSSHLEHVKCFSLGWIMSFVSVVCLYRDHQPNYDLVTNQANKSKMITSCLIGSLLDEMEISIETQVVKEVPGNEEEESFDDDTANYLSEESSHDSETSSEEEAENEVSLDDELSEEDIVKKDDPEKIEEMVENNVEKDVNENLSTETESSQGHDTLQPAASSSSNSTIPILSLEGYNSISVIKRLYPLDESENRIPKKARCITWQVPLPEPINLDIDEGVSISASRQAESISAEIEKTALQMTSNSPVSTTAPIRRSLCQVFQCSHCKATFSSSQRLEAHKSAESHDENSKMETSDGEDDNEDDLEKDEDCNLEIISDSDERRQTTRFQSSSNSESDAENTDDDKSSHEDNDKKPDEMGKKTRQKRKVPDQPKPICPHCTPAVTFSFESQLKWHTRYLHSNGQVKMSTRDPKLFRNVVEIDKIVPEAINNHRCTEENCSKIFGLNEELAHHKKIYHGVGDDGSNQLMCHFCDLALSGVVDLIDHELKHSDDRQKKDKPGFTPGSKFHCGRCDAIFLSKILFINHYLEAHLQMTPIQTKCHICNKIFIHQEIVPIVHYMNYHDLRRLNDPTKPFRCAATECPAYFLTEQQLLQHWNRIHKKALVVNSIEDNISRVDFIEKRKIRDQRFQEKHAKSHRCSKCHKYLKDDVQLRVHILLEHSQDASNSRKRIPAGNILVSTPEQNLTADDIFYDRKAKYFCTVENCKKGFMEEQDLQNHSKLHGEFKCNFCEEVKQFAPELAIHESVHRAGEIQSGKVDSTHSFFCGRCSYSTINRYDFLEHHLGKHLGLEIDKKRCPICKHVYRGRSEESILFKSAMVHHYVKFHDRGDISNSEDTKNIIIYNCERESCIAYFRSPLQLEEHLLDVHEGIPRKERYKCVDCGKCFSNGSCLRNHRIRIHKVFPQDFQFVCNVPECRKRFERLFDLEYHSLKIHVRGEGKLDCPEKCGKYFWTKAALWMHLNGKDHREGDGDESNGKRNHICDECGKGFLNQTGLDAHKIFHAAPETWRFECEVCRKKIATKQKLEMHMRTHTKEKPFVCQVCGVAYAHRHNLRIHVNNKHDTKDVPRAINMLHRKSSMKGKKYKK